MLTTVSVSKTHFLGIRVAQIQVILLRVSWSLLLVYREPTLKTLYAADAEQRVEFNPRSKMINSRSQPVEIKCLLLRCLLPLYRAPNVEKSVCYQ